MNSNIDSFFDDEYPDPLEVMDLTERTFDRLEDCERKDYGDMTNMLNDLLEDKYPDPLENMESIFERLEENEHGYDFIL